MSILPPSNAFLVLTRFATFLLRVRIRSYMNTQLERVNSAGAAWRSCLLRMEWSGLPVWWAEREEWLWRNTATGWCQATTAMRMVAATRPFRYTLGWALFLLLSVFDCMAMESQCCLVCKYFNDSQCIATSPLELLFFISFLTQIFFSISHLMLLITSHFILWLLQTSCSIFIDVACYKHSLVFYACCTISNSITSIHPSTTTSPTSSGIYNYPSSSSVLKNSFSACDDMTEKLSVSFLWHWS